jgi:hypothetical protein
MMISRWPLISWSLAIRATIRALDNGGIGASGSSAVIASLVMGCDPRATSRLGCSSCRTAGMGMTGRSIATDHDPGLGESNAR